MIIKYRRKFAALVFAVVLFASCQQKQEPSNLRLWYKQPAKDWNEALPVGNGRLGAMVFGETGTERIQLNEESLWAGCPVNNNNPAALANLEKVQELIFADKVEEAVGLAEKTMIGTPPEVRSYQTAGDLFLDFGNREVSNYKRELDIETGIARVSYTSGAVNYSEEVLVSAPDNIIAIHIKASENNALNLRIRLEREQDAEVKASKNKLIMNGQIIDEENPKKGPGGAHMRFEAQVKAINVGGSINSDKNTLLVKDANELTLYYTAATDYAIEKLNFDRSINPKVTCEQILSKVEHKEFSAVRKDHLKEYQPMFSRVEFHLEGPDFSAIPTDERLNAVKEGADDPGLVRLYFQYGRYLMLGSSRYPAKLPANLQGIWCKDFVAPWNSDFHTNINLQMNYWPVEVCNISETAEPLIHFFTQLQKPGSVTAREMYGARGWTLHHLTTPFGQTGVMDGIWGLYPMGGPWMTFPFYDHYTFSGDTEYLRNIAYRL